MIVFIGSWRDFRAVFLKPPLPWAWGREVLHGWSRSNRGSQKVTCLVVSLKLQGVGKVGKLRVSIWE